MTTESAAPPGIPAATLVLVRDQDAQPPQLLMIERAAKMAFAAGAMVFPGGRIDPGDHAIAADGALLRGGESADIEERAARIGAIRETIEEVGVAVGLDPVPTPELLAALRQELAEGADFGALLATHGLRLDLDRLTPFARWLPLATEAIARRFDTRFYVAAPPPDAEISADGSESTHALWVTAASVLEDAESGARRVIFPTRRNLERLARFGSHAEVVAHAACHPVDTITPWIEEREGTQWVCIPADRGYPVTSELYATALRG